MTDAALARDELVERVSKAVEGGVDLVQLRDKSLPGGQLMDLTCAVLEAMGGRAKLVVNERADVALAAGAHGVQLGEEGLPAAVARRILGDRLLIGRSVHSTEAAVQAELDGSDFLVVGT
ncbi:MAG: thiamine phosphate synthase, partial [Chloroflexota bacterium]|nr:thiamine phosphate synthase [Chloroflexota bacterium]